MVGVLVEALFFQHCWSESASSLDFSISYACIVLDGLYVFFFIFYSFFFY